MTRDSIIQQNISEAVDVCAGNCYELLDRIVIAGCGVGGGVTNGGGGDGSGFTSRAPTSFVPYVTGKCHTMIKGDSEFLYNQH